MVEINYNSVNPYIAGLAKEKAGKPFAPIYLIYGEELLYKTVLETLIHEMLPASQKKLNYDPIDGTNENVPLALERVNTFSLMSGTKVVALLDAKVFYSKQNETIRLEKAKEAYDQQDLKKSAGYFLGVLGKLQLTLDDIHKMDKTTVFNLESSEEEDHTWIDNLVEYCREHHLVMSPEKEYVQVLEEAIEKGFPKNNHLIITTEIIDKRRRLYLVIKENGVIIDCSVPKGERRADKDAQETVIADRLKILLTRSGKTMNRDASVALFEMTGFDLRTFSNNLEKLIHYVGDRKEIRVDDIESVLERTKKDPIYELSNAVSDRNVENALFFLNSLLSEDIYPLQALAAITNAIRKLLVVKSFVDSPQGGVWRTDCPYNQFQSAVMPAVQAHDKQLMDHLAEWENRLPGSTESPNEESNKVSKSKKRQPNSDLPIAKNPNNPYPVYQTFKKSDKYTTADLIGAIRYLADADRQMKSTGQDPKLVLENTIIRICGVREKG